MGKVISINRKQNEEPETKSKLERIKTSLDRINTLMEELKKKNKDNEERLRKEREDHNKNVLRQYRIKAK